MSPTRFPRLADQLQYLAVVDAGPEAVDRFEKMIAAGEGVKMAAMLATQRSPTAGICDRVVMANAPRLIDQFKDSPHMLEVYRRRYREKTGEDLPHDAVCFRTCADEPGDPGVIVTHKHSLQDVREELARRGKEVHGDWEVTPMQKAPEVQKTRINDFAMARYMAEYKADPAYSHCTDDELREEILATHTKVVTPDDVMGAPTDPLKWAEECFGGIHDGGIKIPAGAATGSEVCDADRDVSSGADAKKPARKRSGNKRAAANPDQAGGRRGSKAAGRTSSTTRSAASKPKRK